MALFRTRTRVLTTRLTAGQCIDRLRRISERDDFHDSRDRSLFEPQTLMLAKTHEGFTLRMRRPGLLSPGVLRVRLEANTGSEERLRLVGRFGVSSANGISVIATMVVVMLGVAWLAKFHSDLLAGLPIVVGVLGVSLLVVLHGRWSLDGDGDGLLDIVKDTVDGDDWRDV